MPPPVPLDSSQIGQFSSLQSYVRECKDEAVREGKGAEAFDPSQTMVANRYEGDGQFHIVTANPEKDFYCAAQVNSKQHEMSIISDKPSQQKSWLVNVIWMSDACSLTRSLVGNEELGGRECRDGLADSRLPAITQMESVQFFLKECNQFLKAYGEQSGRNLEGQVRPERILLLNPTPRDGEFSLKFASDGYQFSCEGKVSTLEGQTMRILAGNPKKEESIAGIGMKLHDACSLTRKALGESELSGECRDFTKREEDIQDGLAKAFHIAMAGWALHDIYKFFRRGWRQTFIGKAISAIRHPFNTLSRLSSWVQGGLGKAGTALSAAGAALSRAGTAMKAFGGLRTPFQVPMLLSRFTGFLGFGAGATGTGAAAGGGTVAAAGAGATAGAILIGAGIGVGIGTLIEYTPRWLGAKKSVSDGIAWGIEGVSEFVTGDKYGFVDGGLNGFKKKWFGWL